MVPNPLMDILSPQQSRQTPSKGGFGRLGDVMGLVSQFRKFAQNVTPEKAEAEIARLLSSGQMSQDQFQELKANAEFILSFLK